MIEIWKPVKEYEGIYEVSNLGRIISLSRDVKSCYGCVGHRRERLKSIQEDRTGYLVVQLYKNSKLKTAKVHRIVAEAFIPNPNNYPCVNHKDENKKNNIVYVNPDGTVDYEKSNLEWCSYKYNSNYGTAISRMSTKHMKRVVKFDSRGNLLESYKSIREAAKANNISESAISSCCNRRNGYKTVYGYIWKRI